VSRSSLILASVLVAGLAGTARAQESVLADGQVSFEFTAGSTQFPAGHYQIMSSSSAPEGPLLIRNVDTKKTTHVEYLTRIASREDGKSTFVFDEVGSQHILSEIHLAGSEGYLLPGAAKKPHTHKQVKVS
jgi:hypothetical protein